MFILGVIMCTCILIVIIIIDTNILFSSVVYCVVVSQVLGMCMCIYTYIHLYFACNRCIVFTNDSRWSWATIPARISFSTASCVSFVICFIFISIAEVVSVCAFSVWFHYIIKNNE